MATLRTHRRIRIGSTGAAAFAGVAVATTALLVPTLAAASTPQAPEAHALAVSAAPGATTSCDGPKPQEMTGSGHNDRGKRPVVYNIDRRSRSNTNFRDTLWTGDNLQLTVMSIRRGDDIGLEMHPKLDQFIRIEAGTAVAKMGSAKNHLTYVRRVDKTSAILIPAGIWHDVINTGRGSLKVYSIYAPPNHPRATLHRTKKDAKNDPLEKKKCPQDLEAK